MTAIKLLTIFAIALIKLIKSNQHQKIFKLVYSWLLLAIFVFLELKTGASIRYLIHSYSELRLLIIDF